MVAGMPGSSTFDCGVTWLEVPQLQFEHHMKKLQNLNSYKSLSMSLLGGGFRGTSLINWSFCFNSYG